jgi:hypothetical protein
MFAAVMRWVQRRRALAHLCREDARCLLRRNPTSAYYDAQRLAARARFSGDADGFSHWARVAAEISRISDNPMDFDVIRAIVDEEERAVRDA